MMKLLIVPNCNSNHHALTCLEKLLELSVMERLFLSLEAKNTIFNMNPASVLFQDGQDQSDIENWLNDNNKTRMYNWSVLAGLQL